MKLSPKAAMIFNQAGVAESLAAEMLKEWRNQNPQLSSVWAHDEWIAEDCVALHKTQKEVTDEK